MIVGLATNVFVSFGDNGRWFFELDLVELGIQDVLDALVGADASGKSILDAKLDQVEPEEPSTVVPETHQNVRGQAYYH